MFTVLPLELGSLTVDKSTLTFMRGFGTPFNVPILAWLLLSDEAPILVDTGAPAPEYVRAQFGPMRQEPEERLEARLLSLGVDPASVATVILTHLHFDHVGGNALFPSAKFVVQRRELDYAQNPLPIHVRGFQHERAGLEPPWRGIDVDEVDGDVDLASGLRVILTPGHTPGLQAVAVETPDGPVVLASDNVPLYENWQGAPPLEQHIPSGVHVDLTEYYASFARLEQEDGVIVPSHDFGVIEAFAKASRT